MQRSRGHSTLHRRSGNSHTTRTAVAWRVLMGSNLRTARHQPPQLFAHARHHRVNQTLIAQEGARTDRVGKESLVRIVQIRVETEFDCGSPRDRYTTSRRDGRATASNEAFVDHELVCTSGERMYCRS